jgi:hypothetical protein
MSDAPSPLHEPETLRGGDASLGRAVAIATLLPIAQNLATQRHREEEVERIGREEKERAERTRRRDEAMRRFRRVATREVFILGFWAAFLFAAALGLSLALTFHAHGADFQTRISAAFYYQWLPAAIGLGAMIAAGCAYDLIRAAGGRPAWSSSSTQQLDVLLFTVGITGVFLWSAGRDGAIPPSAWSAVAPVIGGCFIFTLCVRLIVDRLTNPDLAKVVVLVIAAAGLAGAWFLAPRSDLPSHVTEARVESRLREAVPMEHCSPHAVAALPASLLRNSLKGLIRCRQGGLHGTFMVFRNRQLYDIYVSQRQNTMEHRYAHGVGECEDRGGLYVSRWHEESRPNRDLGAVLCYGSGARSGVSWSDDRSKMYAIISGPSRSDVHGWWHHHSVNLANARD